LSLSCFPCGTTSNDSTMSAIMSFIARHGSRLQQLGFASPIVLTKRSTNTSNSLRRTGLDWRKALMELVFQRLVNLSVNLSSDELRDLFVLNTLTQVSPSQGLSLESLLIFPSRVIFTRCSWTRSWTMNDYKSWSR
jgi:hypothetical protein